MLRVLLIKAPGYGVGGIEIAKLTGWFNALYVDDQEDTIKVRDFSGVLYTVNLKDVQMHKKAEATA